MRPIIKWSGLLVLLLLPMISFGQRWKMQRAEITAGFGSSHYFGDIGGASSDNNWFGLKDIDLFATRPNVNIGGRYRLKEKMNVRANMVFAYLEGADKNSKFAKPPNPRNYAFSTSVYEFTAVYEYCIIPENNPVNYSLSSLWDGLRSTNASLNTYVFGGLGFSFFDVEGLKELDEAERFNPKNQQALVIPLGAGVKYPVAEGIHLSLEIGGRWTTTDFIDGLTTQWSNANDIYYFSMLNVVFKLDLPSRRRYSY